MDRSRARLHQVVVAGALLLRELQIGFGRVDLGRLLLNEGLLQFDLRVEVLDRGFRSRNVGPGLVQRGLEVAVVDPCQQLTGLDRLVIRDQHFGDVAGNLRRDDRGVGFHIGVVGRFEVAAGRDIVVAERGGSGDAEGGGRGQALPAGSPDATEQDGIWPSVQGRKKESTWRSPKPVGSNLNRGDGRHV
ncbi:hypothetical protein ACVWY2_002212 [Bradyrhizobium sp. JR6.1]